MLIWKEPPKVGTQTEEHIGLWEIFKKSVAEGKIKDAPQGQVRTEPKDLWRYYQPDGVLYHDSNTITIFELETEWWSILNKIGLISLMKRVRNIKVKEVFFVVGTKKVRALKETKKEFRDWLNNVEEAEKFRIRVFLVEDQKIYELTEEGEFREC